MAADWIAIRTFNTPNFRVTLSWAYEDSPDLSWDEDGEATAKIDSGEWTNCLFRVAVYGPEGEELAADYLGNSIHADPADFMDHRECGKANRAYAAAGKPGRCGSYFADMVTAACREAREVWARRAAIRLRAA